MRNEDSGSGMPKNTLAMMGVASENDPAGIRYDTIFFKFSNARRPLSMPCTIELKLSSSRMMDAASLATSVPPLPIAMPTSACRLCTQ
eukprot:6140-Eustigmatos_ZCMA.PRE.1